MRQRKRIEYLENIIENCSKFLKSSGISLDFGKLQFFTDSDISEQWKKRPLKYSNNSNDINRQNENKLDKNDSNAESIDLNNDVSKKLMTNGHSNLLLLNSTIPLLPVLPALNKVQNSMILLSGQQFQNIVSIGSENIQKVNNTVQLIEPSLVINGSDNLSDKNKPNSSNVISDCKNSDNELKSKKKKCSNKKSAKLTTIIEKSSLSPIPKLLEHDENDENVDHNENDDVIFIGQKQVETSSPKTDNNISNDKIDKKSDNQINDDDDNNNNVKNSEVDHSKKESTDKLPQKEESLKTKLQETQETASLDNNLLTTSKEVTSKMNLISNDRMEVVSTSYPNASTSSSYYTANLLQSDSSQSNSNKSSITNNDNNKSSKNFLNVSSEPPASLFRFGTKTNMESTNDNVEDSTASQHKGRTSLYSNFDIEYHSISSDFENGSQSIVNNNNNNSNNSNNSVSNDKLSTSLSSFDMTSFVNSNTNNQMSNSFVSTATGNSNLSSFGHHHSYQPTVGDSYTNQFYPNHSNQINATTFAPPALRPLSLDSISNNHHQTHEQVNLIDSNTNFQSNISTTSANLDVDTRYMNRSSTTTSNSNKTNTVTNTSRSKKSNSQPNCVSKRSSISTSSNKNSSGGSNGKKADQILVTSSSSTSTSNKRTSNENFMIPDIISVNQQQQTNYSSSTTISGGEQLLQYNNHRYLFADQPYGSTPSGRRSLTSTASSQQHAQSCDSNQPGPQNGEHSETASNDISNCYPVLFRPHSTNTSFSTTNTITNHSTHQHFHGHNSLTSHNSHQTSLYYHGSSGNVPTTIANHVPNFNLSNIFPDITSTSSTSMMPSPLAPAPVSLNSYSTYSSAPIIDLNSSVPTSSSTGPIKFNSANSFSQNIVQNGGNNSDNLSANSNHSQHFYPSKHSTHFLPSNNNHVSTSNSMPISRGLSSLTGTGISSSLSTATSVNESTSSMMNRSNYHLMPPPPPTENRHNQSHHQSPFSFPYPMPVPTHPHHQSNSANNDSIPVPSNHNYQANNNHHTSDSLSSSHSYFNQSISVPSSSGASISTTNTTPILTSFSRTAPVLNTNSRTSSSTSANRPITFSIFRSLND